MTTPVTIPYRIEHDALGEVEVPADRLWGAQTERSRQNFVIGVERYRWGRPVIRALGILKKCAALANAELGQFPRDKAELIARAAQDVIDGKLDDEFPLVVFHPDQYERQRGDRQPRDPAFRRRSWFQEAADPSQRRRQSQPIVERRVPHGDAHRHGRAAP